jgi:hypothetical protein
MMESLRHDANGYQMPHNMPAPPLMNPPPQIFGGYGNDGLPMQPNMGDMFGDGTLLDESNEAKRRRIARVGWSCNDMHVRSWQSLTCNRLAICVGRKKSSAMVKCQLVRIASTTRRNVYLHRWRKRGIHRKGKSTTRTSQHQILTYLVRNISRALRIG